MLPSVQRRGIVCLPLSCNDCGLVIRTERFFIDRHRTVQEWLSFIVFALHFERKGGWGRLDSKWVRDDSPGVLTDLRVQQHSDCEVN